MIYCESNNSKVAMQSDELSGTVQLRVVVRGFPVHDYDTLPRNLWFSCQMEPPDFLRVDNRGTPRAP